MSEPSTTEPAQQEPNAEPTEPTQGEPADLGDAGKKAIAAERDARKAAEKSAADLQARLDQIESANLTELEKAQKAAQDAQSQLESITQQNLRNQVALAKGVPADLAEFLTGSSEEELNAKADTLLARLNTPTTPRPDPTQGARGTAGPQTNADQFAAVISEAFPS